MSATRSRLAIRPERCDRCGKCIAACPRSLVKVGGGYIYIDVAKCQSCFSCVKACVRGAIERPAAHGLRATPSSAGGARVVVGSRAEAKAYKQEAHAAAKAPTPLAKRPRAVSEGAVATPSPHAFSWAQAIFGRGDGAGARGGGQDARPGISWLPQEVFALLAVMLSAFGLKYVALSSFAFEVMPPAGQVVARSLILAAFYGVQIAAVALLARRRGHGLMSAFGLNRRGVSARERVSNAGLILLLLLGGRAFSTGWAILMRDLGWAPPAVGGAEFTALFGAGIAGLVLTLVAVAVVGPIAEELFFRGAALRMFAERIGEWPAIFVTALLYAGSHVEPWVFVSTFVLGIALGWLAWTRRSLGAAIVLHALYNAVAVIAAFYVAS